MCFSWKPKVLLVQTSEDNTCAHSHLAPFLWLPPEVSRSQILMLDVFSRVSETCLERNSPCEEVFLGSMEGWLACRDYSQGVKKKIIKPMLQGQNCYLIRTHFVKQEGTYEKDTFYTSFLFEHLTTLTNNILQTGTCNLSWQPGLGKRFLFHLFLPVFQVISANRAWGKSILLKVLFQSSCVPPACWITFTNKTDWMHNDNQYWESDSYHTCP